MKKFQFFLGGYAAGTLYGSIPTILLMRHDHAWKIAAMVGAIGLPCGIILWLLLR